MLDNSASMGIIDRDRLRLDTAGAAAVQILDQLAAGDQVAVLPACGPPSAEAGQLDRTQESARQTLGQCRPSYGRADLTAAAPRCPRTVGQVRRAEQADLHLDGHAAGVVGGGKIAGRARARDVPCGTISADSWLSSSAVPSTVDKHRGTLSRRGRSNAREPRSRIAGFPIIVVDCNRQPKPNVAVEAVEVQSPAPVSGVPVKITATLLNTSVVAQQRLVELVIDGLKAASSPELTLPPGGRVKHEFQFAFERGRAAPRRSPAGGRGRIELRRSPLFHDRDRPGQCRSRSSSRGSMKFRISTTRSTWNVALGGGAEAGAVRAATLLAGDLAERTAGEVSGVVLREPAGAAGRGGRAASSLRRRRRQPRLDRRRRRGARGVQPDERGGRGPTAARTAGRRIRAVRDNRDAWHIAWLDKAHPALARLTDPPSLYESVLVYKHVGMAADEAQARVLAKLDDGEPLLVERQIGRGRVVMLGAGVQVGWSNLPLRQIFLPLLMQLTLDLAGVRPCGNELVAGQPISLDLARFAEPVEVEVTRPSGETLRLRSESEPGKIGQVFRYADTHEIGVYILRPLGAVPPAQFVYAVNCDPAEADPQKIDPQELEKQLGGARC